MKLVSGLALTSCVFVGALVSGCSNDSSSNETTTTSNTTTAESNTTATNTASNTAAAGGGKHLKLAFVTNNSSDYWTLAKKGTEKAAKELPNVDVQFKQPSGGTADEQKKIVDDLLVQGIDGIAISPVDAKNEKELLNTAAKKTLVICQDSDATSSNRAFYVGTDNIAAGRMAGEQIKKVLPQGGKVVAFVGLLDAQNAKDRLQGVKDSLKGSNIQFVDTITDNTDHAKAKSNAATILVKSPDVNCMVGLWSYNGPAILSAVKSAGKVGKVQIVCFDEEPDTVAGVKSGAIAATIVQQPYNFGYAAIADMNKYLNGDKSFVPASKQIFIPTRAITKDTIASFSAEMDKLRNS